MILAIILVIAAAFALVFILGSHGLSRSASFLPNPASPPDSTH